MNIETTPPVLGVPAHPKPGLWVQTDRKAHRAWADLITRKPRAAMLLHHLVAQMGHQNAVVVSQKTLARIAGCSVETIKRAAADLKADRWIQVVKLSGPGTVCAYVVNSRVAWGQSRDEMYLSTFSAAVVADLEDQELGEDKKIDLRRIPALYPGELQAPAGMEEPVTVPEEIALPAVRNRP